MEPLLRRHQEVDHDLRRDHRRAQTADALDRAVDEEAAALQALGTATWKKRDDALTSARDFYADEITVQLKSRAPLTPDHVLSYRRLSVVWAVAEVLRTNNLLKE